jgi:hypothetical protein
MNRHIRIANKNVDIAQRADNIISYRTAVIK